MNPKYIITTARVSVLLPLISLFLPFQLTVNEYFDESTEAFVYVGSRTSTGLDLYYIIIGNYLILLLFYAISMNGRTIVHRILTLLLIGAGIPFYYLMSSFLSFHWGTNSFHSYWHYGWYLMIAATVLVAVCGVCYTFGRRPAKEIYRSDVLDDPGNND